MNAKNLKKALFFIQYAASIAIIAYLSFRIRSFRLADVNFFFILLSVISILLMRTLSIARLMILLRNFVHTNLRKAASAQLFGISLGLVTPAKFGESYKVFAIGKNSDEKKKLGIIFIFEKIIDTGIYVVLGLFFAFASGKFISESIVLIILLAAASAFYFIINRKMSLKAAGFFNIKNTLISLMHFLCFIFSFWMISLGAGISISFYSAAMIITLASVLGIISTLPGGLGAREATGTLLFSEIAGTDLSLSGAVIITHTVMNYATTWVATSAFIMFCGRKKVLRALKQIKPF